MEFTSVDEIIAARDPQQKVLGSCLGSKRWACGHVTDQFGLWRGAAAALRHTLTYETYRRLFLQQMRGRIRGAVRSPRPWTSTRCLAAFLPRVFRLRRWKMMELFWWNLEINVAQSDVTMPKCLQSQGELKKMHVLELVLTYTVNHYYYYSVNHCYEH